VKKFWPPGLSLYLRHHPRDAWPLLRAGWRLRGNAWWRRAPFLPLPDAAYWNFRMVTLGVSSTNPLTPIEMVQAAKWSLRQTVHR
jgi:hypothetical protein